MFWKLFGSDERIEKVLHRVKVTEEAIEVPPMSPIVMPANDDGSRAESRSSTRLWIEDWSDEDEARLKDDTLVWDTVYFN